MIELKMILIYLLGVNVIAFILMVADKQKAMKQQYRIPEHTLWLISLIGGALGSFISMNVFRHKTRHRSFVVGMPSLFIFHCIVLLYFFAS
jgi:uncharacterized membrane protein YsdA (DUF1294 family)